MAELLHSAALALLLAVSAFSLQALAADDAAALAPAERSHSYNLEFDDLDGGVALPPIPENVGLAPSPSGVPKSSPLIRKCMDLLSSKNACVLNNIGDDDKVRIHDGCCRSLLEEEEGYRSCFRHLFAPSAEIALDKEIKQCSGELSLRKLLA